jgi:hypothetical protein
VNHPVCTRTPKYTKGARHRDRTLFYDYGDFYQVIINPLKAQFFLLDIIYFLRAHFYYLLLF